MLSIAILSVGITSSDSNVNEKYGPLDNPFLNAGNLVLMRLSTQIRILLLLLG